MARIAAACEGLHFVSETDAPVESVALPLTGGPTPGALLEFLHRGADDPVEILAAAELFTRLTERGDRHDEAEKDLARRFGILRDVPENELDDLRVYRIGKVRAMET